MLIITEKVRDIKSRRYISVNPELHSAFLATGQFVSNESVPPLANSAEGYYARDKQLMKQYKKTFIIADYVTDQSLKLLRYTCAYNQYMKEFFISDIAPTHTNQRSLIRAWNGYKNKCLLTTKIILADNSSYIIRDWDDYNHLASKPHYAFARDMYDPEDAKFHRRAEVTTTYESDLDIYRKKQANSNRLENRFLQLESLLLAADLKVSAKQMYIMLLDDEDYRTHITEIISVNDPREMKWIDQADPCDIIQAYAVIKFNIKHGIDIDPIVVGLDARLHAERVLEIPYENLDKYNTYQGDAIEWDSVGYQAYYGRPMSSRKGQDWGGDLD